MKDGNRLKVLERDATAHCAYIQPVKHWINSWEEAQLTVQRARHTVDEKMVLPFVLPVTSLLLVKQYTVMYEKYAALHQKLNLT